MSLSLDHTNLSLGAVPQTKATTNWTISVSNIKTVQVSNISLSACERDIKEFFSFSGDIQYVEMRRETEKCSGCLRYLQGYTRSRYSNTIDWSQNS